MTNQDKYEYWRFLADYDIGTAKDLITLDRFVYSAVLCQQASERLIKGMFVFHLGREAPKSHNILYLMNKLATAEKFLQIDISARFIEEKNQYEDFVLDLMFYYINDYPFSYKQVKERFIGQKTALEIYDKTIIFMDWLQSFQK